MKNSTKHTAQPTTSHNDHKHIIQWILESWEQERAQVEALAVCISKGLRPEPHADTDVYTEWQLAEVLVEKMADARTINSFLSSYVSNRGAA